jgi:predicted phage-related endonuclease
MPLSALQRAVRHAALGGSDAAPALGLSAWRSTFDLYEEKRAPLQPEPDELRMWLHWGNLIEPLLRTEYTRATGREVIEPAPDHTYRHPHVDFPMVCHPDGVVVGADNGDGMRLFEAKIDRHGHGWGEPGTDEVPLRYMVQVQHNMAVLAAQPDVQPDRDFRWAEVAVLIGGSEFRLYHVPADPDLQDMILHGEREFWRCVEAGTPPPVDFDSPSALAILRKMYPGTDGRRLTATPEQDAWRDVYAQADKWLTQYQNMVDGAKAHLLHAMGEAALLVFSDGMALRRQQVKRKGYTVPDSQYVDARFVKAKD